MITRIRRNKKKPNLTWDGKLQSWVGFRVDIRSGGRRYRPVFPTRKLAEDFEAQLRTKAVYDKVGLTVRSPGNVRISQLFEAKLKRIKATSDNSKRVRLAERVLETFLKFTGDMPVTQVRAAHFQAFLNARQATGIKAATVVRERTDLSSAFHSAAELFPLELEGYDPPKIGNRPKVSKRGGDKRTIDEVEIRAIVDYLLERDRAMGKRKRTNARPVIALMVELAWMLGFRYSEIKDLRKRNFYPKRSRILAKRLKTDTLSTIDYLPARAVEILSQAAEMSKTEFIFDLTCSDDRFIGIIREACEACGIPYGRDELDGVTFHSTRHSFITRMVEVADLPTVKAYSGHSDSTMVALYSHTTDAKRKEAMERLYPGEDPGEIARELFEKVRAGELDLDGFLAALKGRKF